MVGDATAIEACLCFKAAAMVVAGDARTGLSSGSDSGSGSGSGSGCRGGSVTEFRDGSGGGVDSTVDDTAGAGASSAFSR